MALRRLVRGKSGTLKDDGMISQRCSGLVLPPAYATRHTSSLSSRTKMPTSELKFVGAEGFYSAAEGADKFFLVAPAAALKDGTALERLRVSKLPLASTLLPFAETLAAKAGSGSAAGSASSMPVVGTDKEVCVVPLQDAPSSRYYSETQSMAITGGLSAGGITGVAKAVVLIVLADESHLLPSAMAVGRACPLFDMKSKGGFSLEDATIGFATVADPATLIEGAKELDGAALGAASVRKAAEIAETPCEDMSCADVEAVAREMLEGVPGVEITSIIGEDAKAAGLGGIYNVGRASTVPPRLVILKYTPTDAVAAAAPSIGLVGKGIVYDTGGLNLKSTGGRGMKGDMAGSAATLGAFVFWAKFSAAHPEAAFPAPLFGALCLAENCIGPSAYRPDDILTMHSGLTCEVHNTDAEGRFVVGDGCSYLARELGVKTLIDSATLTGHSSFTGSNHCAMMTNDADMEVTGLSSGLQSGETGFPMIFLPEAQKKILSSPIADLVNSGSGVGGMGSAVGGYYIWAQIADVPDVKWLHIDLAGPARNYGISGRSTGFGVGVMGALAYNMATKQSGSPKL